MKAQTYVISAIVFVIIVAIFAVMNVEAVEVNYLFWKGQSPLILVILFSLLMGGLITALAGTMKFIKMNRIQRNLKNDNLSLKQLLTENDIQFEEVDNK